MTRSGLSLFLMIAVFLSGCSRLPALPQSPGNATPGPVVQSQAFSTVTPRPDAQPQGQANEEFIGRVIDMNGIPIQGASVELMKNTTTSDKDGWFRLPSEGLPQWIKVTSPGFISRTRAAAPGIPVLFRLTPDDGKTMVIHFAGDTMFGRRFFDPNEDDYTADGLLPLDPTVEDHARLLAPIKPLLENADFTVLNLETTFSHQPYFRQRDARPLAFHATASHVYASNPNAVRALKQSGVDIVDLGNNHTYDMLEVGLSTSLSALDQAGVLHFGAGTNEANAWAPVIITSKRQTVAFVGCTTLRIPLNTPIRNDVPFVASDVLQKGGAAYCAEAALRSAVIAAKRQADAVVVMIHGGREYDRNPTSKITYLTEIARQAGATLVVNHQPHVVGGLSLKDQSLVTWTLGNFLTDQTVWPSFESYMLAVYLQEGKIIRAYIEPLIIDGFLPHGLTRELADYVVRGAAGRETGPFIMESGAMEVDLEGRALQHTYIQTMESASRSGEIIQIPQARWISDFKGTGKLLLGRDLLWVGGFENDEVDSASRVAPLWDLTLGNIQIGQDYAYEGETGIRLTRGANQIEDAVTTNLHRVLVVPNTDISVTGMIRINQGVVVLAQLSWYQATVGPSFVKTTQPIEIQAYGTWQPFRIDVQVPPKTVALGLYLRLTPPDKGTVTADFDNIRIIEWVKPAAQYSPLYNYALLTGTGDLTFAQEILPGAEQWVTGPQVDQNK
ncbi:MAG: CapA family protein [Anaerolineae bacterium]|nr:CapA family protein [Anaerolineae bacterium]MCI0607591.1 CapA family protein [Anaerolineae bacterium]